MEDNSGIFTEVNNGEVDESYTFTWTKFGDIYTAVVDNTSEFEAYAIGDLLGNKTLEDNEGFIVAIKE